MMCWWQDWFQTFALDSKGRMQPLFSVLWNYAAVNSVSEDPKDFETSGNFHKDILFIPSMDLISSQFKPKGVWDMKWAQVQQDALYFFFLTL